MPHDQCLAWLSKQRETVNHLMYCIDVATGKLAETARSLRENWDLMDDDEMLRYQADKEIQMQQASPRPPVQVLALVLCNDEGNEVKSGLGTLCGP